MQRKDESSVPDQGRSKSSSRGPSERGSQRASLVTVPDDDSIDGAGALYDVITSNYHVISTG